jgi:alkylation response protein AidB-like acyl-CoA dehydrogenase
VRLEGVLRFASGAGLLDRALIPVWLDDGKHLLMDLDVADLPVDTSGWHTGAMAASRTHQVKVDGDVSADDQIGVVDFYLQRPDFFPGGVGVAACWVGGAARVLDLVHARHPQPSPTQQIRLGRMRIDLSVAAATVRSTAALLDRGSHPRAEGEVDWQALSAEARAGAAEAVRRLIGDARLLSGPAGLAMDEGLAHAVPDLELYVLQQNSDADAFALGDPRRRR